MESTSAKKIESKELHGRELARECGRFADFKQAEDILILDLRGLSQLTDFFVVCSGSSLPHLRAIRDEIDGRLMKEHGVRPLHRDGVLESKWMVLDYIDVMVHIFHREMRPRYALEDLWSDAPRLSWETGEPAEETEDD